MIKLLSHNLIALILVLGFAPVVRPINVSEQAIEKEKQALPMFQAGDKPLYNLDQVQTDRFLEALNLSNLAYRYYNNQNYFTALKNINKAIKIVEQIRSNIASKDIKTSFFTTTESYYELKTVILMQLHQQQPNKGYDILAFEASEQGKARSLLELLQEANIDIRKGVAPDLLAEEKEIRIKLDAVERKRISLCNRNCSQRLLTQLETERSQLLGQYQQIQTQIRANSPKYAELTQPEPIKLQELPQLLDEDTVLWQYSLGRDQSYVWVITKDSFTTQEIASRQEIETVAREYHKLLQYESNQKKLNSVATKLSQLITPPIAEVRQKSRIVIVADGALQYIPFASLPIEDNQLLFQHHQIINLPSSSVLASLRTNQQNKIPANKKLAVIADPIFSRNDIRLPQKKLPGTEDLEYDPLRSAIRSSDLKLARVIGTRQEAEGILAFVPESQKIAAFDFDANLAFATSPELSNYSIIHFATHGIINREQPYLSAIVLSLFDEKGNPQNGFLRLYEIFNLNLAADLVVLSTSESGLGKEIEGEGLIGLTRGFMYAGTTRVLVSLWSIDDDATAEFMSKFYGFMLQDNLSPAAALNATQEYMQNHDKWSHPFYWAAFTLQGDWVGK